MKKIMGLAIALAVAFAFSANAADTTATKTTLKTGTGTEKVTTTAKPGEKDVTIEKTGKGVTEKINAEKTATTTTVTDTKTMTKGNVVEDVVTFKKYEASGDYVYVVKDGKEIRLKHKLNDNMKKDMLGWKEGTQIKVTSTYPLTQADVAVITDAKVANKVAETATALKAAEAKTTTATTKATETKTTTTTKATETKTTPTK